MRLRMGQQASKRAARQPADTALALNEAVEALGMS